MYQEEDDDESMIQLLDKKINITRYKKDLSDQHMFNSTKLLSTTLPTFAFQTHIPIDICEKILSTISESIIPPITIVEHYEPKPRFYDRILDSLLPMPDSGIVELCGQASAGKSNIAYHLAVQQRIHDISRKVVIISTEGKVPTERIHQICQNTETIYSPEEILDGIMISQASTVEQLKALIHSDLTNLFFEVDTLHPSLVIIDSIAALFRIEYDVAHASEKSIILFDITSTLKYLCASFDTLFIVTNQATANLNSFTIGSNDWIPALGYSWSNCINIRMRISKTHMKHAITSENPITSNPSMTNDSRRSLSTAPIRTIFVEISPIKQGVRAELYIDNSGVHGI